MHPAIRGSVHIQSSDCTVPARIDPGYFISKSDLELAKLGLKYAMKLSETEHWKKVTRKCLLYDELREAEKVEKEKGGGNDAIGRYCREWVATTFHQIGTAAMLPKEKDGVVDSRLRVHGVANLRVVRGRSSCLLGSLLMKNIGRRFRDTDGTVLSYICNW